MGQPMASSGLDSEKVRTLLLPPLCPITNVDKQEETLGTSILCVQLTFVSQAPR